VSSFTSLQLDFVNWYLTIRYQATAGKIDYTCNKDFDTL